jgi:transcriptional regulator with XRE-family HTH domain
MNTTENKIVATVGQRIQKAREAAQMTQAKLGEMLGVSRTAVTQWEAGLTFPNFEKTLEMAKLLRVRPEFIAFAVDNLVEFRTPVESMDVPTIYFGQDVTDRTTVDTQYQSKKLLAAKGVNTGEGAAPFYWKIESESFAVRYPAGALLLLDGSVDRFVGEGDYLIWNGFTVQLVNMSVNFGDPQTVNVQTTANGAFQSIDVKKIQVLGRVRGAII